MEKLQLNDLDNKLTPSEAAEVKGGLRYMMKELLVPSYQMGGSQ